MHDLKTIQRMNAEAARDLNQEAAQRREAKIPTTHDFQVGDRVISVSDYRHRHVGTVTFVAPGDDSQLSVRVNYDNGEIRWMRRNELDLYVETTPEQIAQRVLDNHGILDFWVQSGEEIRELLIEAVRIATN